MSVIQRIRDKGAWFIFGIIALALLAFILQDGSFSKGNMFANTTTLGKVNGEKIERADFEQKIEMYGGRGSNREQLISQLWNVEVNNLVYNQEYKKLGLTVSANELRDILLDPNRSPLKKEFTDPQTGEFKVDEVRRVLEQLKKSKNKEQIRGVEEGYLKPAMQQALQVKYTALLQQSAYVPKWMIEKEAADNNAISTASFVMVPYTSISDSSFKVSDDEILNYANKHKKEYEKDEEARSIEYVSFDASASAADSAATLKQLNDLKDAFQSTEDIKAFFARNNSEIPYYDGFVSKKEIKQAKIDSIVKTPVGSIYGPYLDGQNFVLAKIIAVKQLPDSSKVRHILIATHQQDPQTGSLQRVREDSTARKIMDTVEMQLKAGVPFDSVCAKFSDDGNKNKGGVYDYFTTARMVPTFNNFAFDKPVGSKGVIQTDYGFHYVEVLGQKGNSPAYKIAYLAKPIIISNETDAAALNAASQFAANAKNKKLFNDNALKLNKQTMSAFDIKENDYSINGLGESRSLVRWIYAHNTGEVNELPVRIGDKYIVPIVTSVNKIGLPSANMLRPLIEPIIKNEKKAKEIINSKMKGNTLNAIATSSGSTVQKADSILFNNPFVPGIGNDSKFIGAAFNKSIISKTTEPIAGTSGVFVLQVDAITSRATPENLENIKQNIVQAQRMASYRGAEALRKAASIKDYRSKFY